MPSVKAVAQALITAAWPLTPDMFEALWAQWEAFPLLTPTPGADAATEFLGLPLGAAGPQGSPPITAVFVFTQTAHLVGPDASLEEILSAALATATAWGQEGTTRRLVVLADKVSHAQSQPGAAPNVPETAASTGVVATIYTHENPDGYAATKQDRDTWLTRITSVMIFIRHELNLPYGYKGELYLNCGDAPPKLDAEVPKLQYNILRHLLRHQAAKAKRTLPAIMKACWSNEPTAVRQADELQDGINKPDRKYDTAITKLSTMLQARCSTAVRTAQTGIYDLQPPPTYCLIEEGTTSTDT